MGKRGRGFGAVYQRRDGRWERPALLLRAHPPRCDPPAVAEGNAGRLSPRNALTEAARGLAILVVFVPRRRRRL